jgi:hypothetical protein
MTDALIKVWKPDTSCARACYVGRLYSSAFVVASVFVVAYPTVFRWKTKSLVRNGVGGCVRLKMDGKMGWEDMGCIHMAWNAALWVQSWTFGFRDMREISCLDKELLAFTLGPCCMQWGVWLMSQHGWRLKCSRFDGVWHSMANCPCHVLGKTCKGTDKERTNTWIVLYKTVCLGMCKLGASIGGCWRGPRCSLQQP